MTTSVWSGPLSALAAQVAALYSSSYPSVTTGSLLMLAADQNRTYLSVQNNNTNGVNLRVEFDSDAGLTTFRIAPGQTWAPIKCPINAIYCIGEKGGVATAMSAGDVVVQVGTSPV